MGRTKESKFPGSRVLEGYMRDLSIINFLAYLYFMCVSVRKHVWALSFFQYFKSSFAL